jgi:hypothetical protein
VQALTFPHFDAQFPRFSLIHLYIIKPWHNGTMGHLRRINQLNPMAHPWHIHGTMAQWMSQWRV